MIYQIVRTYIKRSVVIAETNDKAMANEILKNNREWVKKNGVAYCGQVLFSVNSVKAGTMLAK
jgi:hypothetical protein